MSRRFQRSFALLATAVVVSCGGQSVHHGLSANVLPSATASLAPRTVTHAPTQTVQDDRSPDVAGEAVPALDNAPLEPKSALGLQPGELLIEPPTISGVRVRPSGAVAASADDEALQVWNYGGCSDASHVSNKPGYHPGTRVIVDIKPRFSRRFAPSKLARELSNRLLAGLRNRGYWPFRTCFEDANREHASAGGKTNLRVVLNADGTVISSRLVRSTLKTRIGPLCIARVGRGLKIDRVLGRRVEADVVVSTWPGDLPLLPLPATLPPEVASGLQAVRSALADSKDLFFACFEAARHKDSRIWGRLALSFKVDLGGAVAVVREDGSHFANAETIACATRTLQTIALPVPAAKARFEIAFRLVKPTVLPESTSSDGAPLPKSESTEATGSVEKLEVNELEDKEPTSP